MALQEINVPISFSQGLNTKTDSKQVMQGQLLSLSNGVFTKIRAINEDPGYLPVPQTLYNSTGAAGVGNSINTFNTELVKTDSQFLYSFSETTQSWVQTPTKVANSISSVPIGANAIGNSAIGLSANSAGLEFYTYYQLSNLVGSAAGAVSIQSTNVVIFDPVSSTTLYTNQIAYPSGGSSITPPIFSLSISTTFIALWYDLIGGSTGNLNAISLNSSAPPQTLTSTPLITNINASSTPDVVQNAGQFYVLYQDTSDNIVLTEYSSALTVINTTIVANPGTIAGALGLEIDLTTNNLYVTYSVGTAITFAVYSVTLVLLVGPTVVTGSISSTVLRLASLLVSANLLYIYVQQISQTSGYSDVVVYAVNLTTGVTPGILEGFFGGYLVTKPYLYNALPTINLGFYDFTLPEPNVPNPLLDQSVYFTIQQSIPNNNYTLKTPYAIIAKFAEGNAGAPLAANNISGAEGPAPISTVLIKSATNVIIPYLYSVNTDINSNVTLGIYNVGRLDATWGTKTRSVELGNNLNITGGVLSIYDSTGIAESGFHIFPWQTTSAFAVVTASGTPPSLSAGQYTYVVTYEWTDDFGNLHRSAPGAATVGTAAAAAANQISQATITVNATSFSEEYKIYNIQVVLWRTVANGSIFYRIRSAPNPPFGSVANIKFVDSQPDNAIQDSTQLYTTGGEVDNISPPASDIIFPYKNRIIAVEADNPYVWWYSKQVIQGFPVEFSDFFTQNIDMTGGPISAGYTMDDKLIFFKNYSMFYVIGDGPSPNGQSNDFSYPQVITTDVGCMNQDSIIVIPLGLMFQSTDKGIYLLDRSLQVNYIGAPVEAFNGFTVTSAQLLPNTTQVRFTLNTSTVLIFDYLVGQWSTHTDLSFVDSTIYKQLHTGLTAPASLVLEQIQGQWIDNTTPLALSLTTGWFEFAQLQGYQRTKEFLLLLTSVNATSLQIQIFNNFDTTTPIQTDLIQIPANTMRQQYRIFPAFQKAQSMQIVITEIPTGAQAGGLLLSGMSFTMAVKRGLNKLPAVQAYG